MSAPGLDRAIAVACQNFVDTTAAQVTCLSRAPSSGTYRVHLDGGRSVIAKLYFGAAKWKATKERNIIDSLSNNGVIRTARVLGYDQLEIYDATVLITSDLGECTLWGAIEAGRYSYHGGLSLVGRLLANFHDIDLAITAADDEPLATKFERLARWHLSILDRNPQDGLASHVEPALDTLVRLCRQPNPQIGCHGDLHPANVVTQVRSNVSAAHLVDFESAVRCPLEYDLAKSVATSSALGDHDRMALLAGYGDRRPVSEELLYAFVVFHVVDGWVHAALLEGRDRSLWRSRIDEVVARYAPLFQ